MRNLQNIRFERDVNLLITSMGVVSFTGGFAQVVQSIYLARIGVPPVFIGLLASIALIAGAFRMMLFSVLSDKFGRRKILFIIFITSVLHNLIYFVARDFPFFLLAAIIGGAGGEGYGGSVEAAFLAEKAGDRRRTLIFSIQYFVSSFFSALGSFASGLPELLATSLNIKILDAVRFTYAFQAMLVLVPSTLTLLVSENSYSVRDKKSFYLSKESQKKMAKLSVTYAFDGFGVGLIISIVSLWFYLRFGISIKTAGYIFTASKILETITYLLTPLIASKLGLVRTVSIARLGGAISVGLMAFMPTHFLAAVMFIMRNTVQHISIPLRQSYAMAIFPSNERASATSISDFIRVLGHTSATALSGYIMENVNTTLSPIFSALFVGAASQLYRFFFRAVKPPEERG